MLNKNHRSEMTRSKRTTQIYLPENVIETFEKYYGLKEHFDFLEKTGYTKTQIISLDKKILFNDVSMMPFQMAEDFVTGFDVQYKGKKALIIMDETLGWMPKPDQTGYDVVIMPMGVVEFHPLSGKRIIREGHDILKNEATFEAVLQIVKALKAKRVILSHIGEGDQLSYDELLLIQKKMQDDRLPVEFAFDGMKISL